jgi:hypothetical protein
VPDEKFLGVTYLGRPSVFHFDQMISIAMKENSRIATVTRQGDLSELQLGRQPDHPARTQSCIEHTRIGTPGVFVCRRCPSSSTHGESGHHFLFAEKLIGNIYLEGRLEIP